MIFSRPFRQAVFAFLFVGASIVESAQAQAPEKVLLPVPPKELVKALPDAPPDWKITASSAKHIPQSRPLSRAIREYTHTPPPSAPASPEPVPGKVKITIVDTAGNPGIAVFLTGTETVPGTKRLTVESMPARRVEGTGETDHLEVLALDRFLVTIVQEGGGKEKSEDWVRRINLQALRQLASQAAYFDPKKEFLFISESVDELNPRRTRSTKWALGAEIEEKDLSTER